MNTRLLYTAAGIFSLLLFIAALVLFATSESLELLSQSPLAFTLLLVSVFFLALLYFMLSFRKREVIRLEPETSGQQLLKTEEEQETEEKQAKKEGTENARELGKRLFETQQGDSPQALAQNILTAFAQELNTVQSLLFIRKPEDSVFSVLAKYAYYSVEPPKDFEEGEGITGQAAKDKRILNIKTIPDGYITVLSGLGSSTPRNLLVLPFVHKDKTVAILETASFQAFPEYIEEACKMFNEKIGERFFELQQKTTVQNS
jgi:hypothetical protein